MTRHNHPPPFCIALANSFALAAPPLPEAIYDEAKVPKYTLPDPLSMQNGERVTTAEAWRAKRRPEL